MIAKYNIEYSSGSKVHGEPSHYVTDDPVACEEFMLELLERGFKVRGVKHEGVDLPRQDFDRIVRNAAGALAAKHIAASLDLKSDEVKYRFGFAA